MPIRPWIGRGAALAWLVATSAVGQTGVEPRLRDATSDLPKEVVSGAPFDVAQRLKLPPSDRNAAPLYLDALLEFSPEVADTFPAGPERDRRRALAADRLKKFNELSQALQKDAGAVPGASIDAVVGEYREGFRKLAAAQKRDRCVFETGIGVTATLPHAQAARQAVRVAALKVRRELDRGEIDAAIADLKMTLRFTRDLQPRGYFIAQLVAVAMNSVAVRDMVMPVLAAPGLTAAQCGELAGVLADHDVRSIDAYAEGVGMEYLSTRVTLVDLIRHQEKLAKAMNLQPGESIIKRLFNVTSMLAAGQAAPKGVPGGPTFPEDADTVITRVRPEELDRAVGRINTFYAALLALKAKPALEQLSRLPDAATFFAGDSVLDAVTREMQPATGAVVLAIARGAATVRAGECLAAARRWQLTHNSAAPADLDAACRAAGLKGVPADPYDGKPMRMATVGRETVVYSVGKDGKDDGGKVDSENDRKPGDLVFRLPAAGAGR